MLNEGLAVTDQPLTRREMLVRGAGAVAAAGAFTAGAFLLHDPTGQAGLDTGTGKELVPKNFFAEVDFPPSAPRISIATGGADQTEQMVRAAVAGLAPSRGIAQFISPGDVVLIKPNVGFDRPPYLGATTHPEVVRGVIRLCKEAGARRVLVADHPIEAPTACFARSGIGDVVRAEGAELFFPTTADFVTLVLRSRRPDRLQGEALDRWPVLGPPLAQATKIIGVAPIKDHNLCSASMNLKNWYGLLGGRRDKFHQAIHHVISDLAMAFSPTLVIADATRVMMRNGPTGGRVSDVSPGGLLVRAAVIASVDPVACDAWCYENLLGRDPNHLAYLDLASRKIALQIAQGAKRFAERDWRVYAREGRIVSAAV